MTTTAAPIAVTHRAPYRADGFGGALLARFGQGAPPAGFPLLDPAQVALRPDPPTLDRHAMADALAAYNASVGNALADATVEALRTNGHLIISGQQPGLLLGPLFSPLKAITALKLAEHLSDDTLPVLPAFWIASEDHDLAEVDHCYVGSRRFVADHAGLRHATHRPPVGRVSLVDQHDRLLAYLDESLPPTPYKADALDAVAAADATSYATLFATLFAGLFGPGRFVLIDPMQVRPILAPALARVVERWRDAQAAFVQGAGAIRAAGFEPQLDRLTVFEIADGVRRPVTDIDPEAVLAAPERFSPGAGVRPIVQDLALPTLAQVGGPSELVYLWQIDPVYAAVGGERAKLWPRCTATLVGPRQVELGKRFGLTPAQLIEAPARLATFDPAPEAAQLEAATERLLAEVDRLDDGRNPKLFDRARRSVRYHVDRIGRRGAIDRLNDEGRGDRALAALAEAVAPGGAPQERRINLIELIALHGLGIVDRLTEACDPLDIAHRVIELK